MAKRVKKKIKFKIVPIFIFLLICGLLYLLGTILYETKIKNIYVVNNNILSDQEVIELAELEDYPGFFKVTSKKIKENIKKNKIVKDVKVKRKFFNVLEIQVDEYEPLFIKDNQTVLENKLKIDKVLYKLPVLSNLEENDIYDSLIKKMLLTKKEARDDISQIIYSPTEYDNARFLLYMDDGNHVYINLIKFTNLNYYSDIYPTLNNKKGTLYLDSGNHFEIFK